MRQVDILRNDSLSRDHVLAEEIRLHTQAKLARDALRVEHDKSQAALRARKDEEARLLLEGDKLNAVISK